MPHNARQLGLAGTRDVLRQLLVDRFGLVTRPADIPDDEPLFSVGVGLSSLDGMEFLLELERQFQVKIKDVDWWVYESPTLTNVAELLISLTADRP